MKGATVLRPGYWQDGELPPNVRLGPNTVLTGDGAFRQSRSAADPALIVGAHCTMDTVQFGLLGAEARKTIGDYCYFANALLLCELELRIGSYVVIGWNATILDADLHPLLPAERIADAIAISPLCKGRLRPTFSRQPVVIEDEVWIGPNALILKGVGVGTGAFIEPGAVVTSDVPARARVAGNPARVVGQV